MAACGPMLPHARVTCLRTHCDNRAQWLPDTSWTFEPGAIVLIGALGGVYVRRWRRVRAQRRPARAPRGADGRLLSFLGGLLALVVALISPVDRLAEQAFAMHMVQHLLLLDIAPILLICGLTRCILRPVTRRLQRLEEAAGSLGHPVFAVFALRRRSCGPGTCRRSTTPRSSTRRPRPRARLLHERRAPVLVAPALADPQPPPPERDGRRRLHALDEAARRPARHRPHVRPRALYAFYEHQAPIWGLTPAEDQSLAGGLMALEQSVVMGIALVWLFVSALSASDAAERRAERYAAQLHLTAALSVSLR